MKKKLLCTIIITTLVFTSCGKNNVDLSVKNQSVPEETTTSTEDTSVEEQSIITEELDDDLEVTSEEISSNDDTPVTVTMKMFSFNDESIEDYIISLQEENPDIEYSVYNDEYYNQVITKSERKEVLANFEDHDYIDSLFQDAFSDDSLKDVFTNMEYDDSYQNFSFYVNKEAYDANQFGASLMVGLTVSVLSDSYQAYNFIPPEERITNIKFIDADTNDEITTE